jgi:hypothetical protein
VVPSLVLAQYYPNPTTSNYCNTSFPLWGATSNCTPGVLQVYVQVTTNTTGTTRNPQDFTVTVSGNNPSPASFPGSVSGTFVSVGGGYSVVVAQLPGYVASYSTGCTGTLTNNQQALCVVTESANYPYYNAPQPYPYPYTNTTLSCTPASQTVGFMQTATFTATGGSGPYTWATSNQTYQGIGPVLNVSLPTTGLQAVTVSSGGQSATCTVNIVPGTTSAQVQAYPTTPSAPLGITLTQVPPTIPNTGYEPLSSASIAFALAALVAVAIVAFTYVKQAFAALLG